MTRSLPSLKTIIALDLFITNRWVPRLLASPGQQQHFKSAPENLPDIAK